MRTIGTVLALIGVVLGAVAIGATSRAQDKVKNSSDHLAHMVYFKLKDNSPKATADLVTSCQKYLSGHEGTVYFSTGVLAKDLNREVNDREFDVALHLVFKDRPSYEKYAVHPRHDEFIKLGKDNWAKVRVFDANVVFEK
jgi:hypothetical protein